MKKLLSILLVLTLTAALFAGCANSGSNNATPTPAPTQSQDNGDNTSSIVKLGLGQNTTIAKSKSAEGENGPVAQVDTVIAAVGFDKDGKIVSVTIDTAQTKVGFNKDGSLAADPAAEQKTKVELGDGYGMKKNSGIGKEWYEQIAELEKWMVGKTVEEVKAMKTTKKDDAHPAVPDVPELTSLVTVSVQDYIAAVVEAYENAVDVQGGAEKVGLGHVISIAKSKGAEGDKGAVGQVDTVMSAAAFTADGKTAGVIIDTAQTKVEFDKEGKLTSDTSADQKTKVELGDAYGMKSKSGIGKEWYEQIAELQKWMIGKNVEEIKAMKTKDGSPDEPDLTSLVTVSVQDYIASVEEAYTKAR